MVKVVQLTVEAFVLSGSLALRSMPHNLSQGLASARRRWPVCTRVKRIFSFWENFCQVALEDYDFAFLLLEIVIEAAYMTAEAFWLSGKVSSKY